MLKGYNKTDSFFYLARQESVNWANGLLSDSAGFVILDTETTGLDSVDEVVQIGVIDGMGTILVDNQLIRPTCSMDPRAQLVHGISEDMLKDAPSFQDYYPSLDSAIGDRKIIIYNAEFDTRILDQSGRPYSFYFTEKFREVECAMIQYAKFFGAWNERKGSFRWQKLPGGDHSAVGDCLSVLQLIRQMASDQPNNS